MNAAAWGLVPVAYLLGTFPSAAIVARASGIDIRSVGSGNPGTANVTRVLGWRRGIWVFVLDAAKGTIAAAAGLVVADRPAGYVLAAAAVVGHVFPAWERFRGGKGVATGGGAFLALAPITAVTLVALWWVVSRLSRKAALASILVTTLLPVGVGVEHRAWWEVLATAGICALVMVRHTGNIARMVRGDEHAIGR